MEAESTQENGKETSDKGAAKTMHEIGGYVSIEEFTKNGLGEIVAATKAMNAFPSGASRDLYSAHPTFGKIVETQCSQILEIISGVLRQQKVKGNMQRRDRDERFEMLMECNDVMLERVGCGLDELAGIRKDPEMILVDTDFISSPLPSKYVSKTVHSESPRTPKLFAAKNILRPQAVFKIPVDNTSAAFEPRLKYKPNSIKPLAILPEYADDGTVANYLHPYEIELNKFEVPSHQLKSVTPEMPNAVETTPLKYVDTVEDLKDLVKDLVGVKQLAIDLEHHSYRTFQGITCLMQISTRNKDYLIDTLTLREDLHVLNEFFTDPTVVKVLHGADSDVDWLQRDLSLYLVNMFDTHQAAKRLNLSRLSLAYLLKHYCEVDADKAFQLADWRIRPLPEELRSYARQDTHYLLYIFDVLTNELLQLPNGENILKSVYQSSTELCHKRYQKPVITPESHLELYRKSKKIFDNRQLYALSEIFMWRDRMARTEDESYGYVLPNHMMMHISETLPREMQGVLACCNPIPPLVRQHLHTLHSIVLKAREQPLVKPITEEPITNRGALLTDNKDFDGFLYCPHDLSQTNEFRDDLPTLLGNVSEEVTTFTSVKSRLIADHPHLSIFDTPNNSDEEMNGTMEKLKQIKFVSPYARYLAVLPFAEKQRLEELAKEQTILKKKLLCPVVPIKVEPEEENIRFNASVKMEKRKSESAPSITSSDNVPYKKPKIEHNRKANAGHANKASKDMKVSEIIQDSKKKIIEEATQQQLQDTAGGSRSNKNFKNRKNKRPNHQPPPPVTPQKSDEPVQFNYGQVDFQQFKGGSKKTVPANELNSKFKSKGKFNKANNKKLNKMFNTGNKGNKKK